ncbi:MAG: phosphatidylglycerol lysyltransferase domain-containing protein [Bacteroidales bacterium]|nr:phosphatidylglycerol lysyltransferase domain-containing protein [Bacteroidales bacterium]
MNQAKSFISKLLYNKFTWQLIFSTFLIGMALFFIRHENIELSGIKDQLASSNPWFVALGIFVTCVYIVFQAQMYIHSYKSMGINIPLKAALRLFLKRNFISVFLPAGGFSSLAFFSGEIENRGASKSQIHLASTFFAFFSILSVVIIAFPIFGFALLRYNLQNAELIGFIILILIFIKLFLLIYSVSKKGKVYRWLLKVRPSLTVTLDEMISQSINRNQLWITLLFSMGIEILGIIHLYIAMLALGFEPSWPAAFIGYIVMVVILIASPFLRGLGAIEVSLTFLLGQFGFPVIAAASITLMYRFFEFWLPLLAGIGSFISRRNNVILRILPPMIIFVLGVVNIISSITPAIPIRLKLVNEFLPSALISNSNEIVLVVGLLLIILSVFLLQGSRRAWYIGLFLTGISALGHLFKGVDYEEAILAFIAAVSLFYTRAHYTLKPHRRLTRISYYVLLYSLAAVLLYGIIGFYFIDKHHFGVNFELWTSVKITFKMFFLFDASGLHPLTTFGHNFLYSIYFLGALLACFIFYSILKPYFSKPYNSKEDFDNAKKIINRYGNSPLDFFKTYPDKSIFLSKDHDGFVSFKMTRQFAFVLENPVCKDDEALVKIVRDFDQFCIENGFVSIYYRIPEQSLDLYKNLGKKSFPIGEEAIVDLTTFTMEGGKIKPTRSAINRLTSEGFDIKIYQPPIKEGLLQKLEMVSNNWLSHMNQKEIAFTQGVFDRVILKGQTIITVEDKEERVYAFLNLIPDFAPGEGTYDLIRKIDDAPNGVLDLLIAKTLLYLKDKGYKSANLGMAPLSGIEGINLAEKAINYAYENLKAFGHFKGLRKYKEKFFPSWKKKFLVYNYDYNLLQVPNALRRVSEGK